jgi:hypothetical protein
MEVIFCDFGSALLGLYTIDGSQVKNVSKQASDYLRSETVLARLTIFRFCRMNY